MRRIILLLVCSFLSLSGVVEAQRDFYIKKNDGSVVKPGKEKRVALVIGNNNYTYASSLKNPVNDASDMKTTLERLGFEVLYLYNGNRAQMISKVQSFRSKIGGVNTVALFFYAGHGIQASDDNWLVPTDANPQTRADVGVSCIGLNYLMQNLESVNSGTNIIILDACRNNPFRYSGRTTDGGLKNPNTTPRGTFIAFSTAPNQVAADGTGRNSPYTAALKKALLVPNIPIEQTFKNVRNRLSGQTSWENSSLTGDFYFNPTGGGGGDSTKDSDGDGLTDNVDECPNEYGKIQNMGCPDNTNDPFAGQMVFVEGGRFQMGSNGSEALDREKPVHWVSVPSFRMGKYEVTQRQWQEIMGENPSHFKNCEQCPVENVSWDDIQEFLKKLNAQTKKKYRLPTEAEWEYAARGGKESESYKYAGSNTLVGVAWVYDNSRKLGSSHENYGTNPVGRKSANELGLFDMTGNVWEWCEDKWHENYNGVPSDGSAWLGDSRRRVLRGGSWYSYAEICRVSYRSRDTASERDHFTGFRLVLP